MEYQDMQEMQEMITKKDKIQKNGTIEKYISYLDNKAELAGIGGSAGSGDLKSWQERGLTVQPVETNVRYHCEPGTKFNNILTDDSEIVVDLYTNGTYNIQIIGRTLTKENSKVEVRDTNTIIILISEAEFAKFIVSNDANTAKVYIDGRSVSELEEGVDPIWLEGDKTLVLNNQL